MNIPIYIPGISSVTHQWNNMPCHANFPTAPKYGNLVQTKCQFLKYISCYGLIRHYGTSGQHQFSSWWLPPCKTDNVWQRWSSLTPHTTTSSYDHCQHQFSWWWWWWWCPYAKTNIGWQRSDGGVLTLMSSFTSHCSLFYKVFPIIYIPLFQFLYIFPTTFIVFHRRNNLFYCPDLGKLSFKKNGKKGDIVPFWRPPPKRVKRGHLSSDYRQKCVNATRDILMSKAHKMTILTTTMPANSWLENSNRLSRRWREAPQ